MRIQASAGRSKKDLRDHCAKLTLTSDQDLEGEMLSRLYKEITSGNTGSLLFYLRQVQDEGMEPSFSKPK